MRKILGVNISHNVSFAYFEDNILKEYYEEDRFNKIKNYIPEDNEDSIFNYQYKVLEKFKNINFDIVIFASFDRGFMQLETPIIKHFLKQIRYKEYVFNINNHHIYHATCGYYFSKFKEAVAIITDGGGERIYHHDFQVMESIFSIGEKQIKKFYQNASNVRSYYFQDYKENIERNIKGGPYDLTISNKELGANKYESYTAKAGFKSGEEEGQLMGIAAYKDKDTNLDKGVLELANKAQEETLQERIELIEKAKTYSDCKNIILSGGYHLNCSNNFKLIKHFPELNFFVDPIPYDGGTAVGAAYYCENYL